MVLIGLKVSRRSVFRGEVLPRAGQTVAPHALKQQLTAMQQTASIWSYIGSYDWIQNIIIVGWKHDIEEKHLPELPDYDRSRLWYSKYVQNRKSSALKTILHLFQLDFAAMTCCSILVGILQVSFVVCGR